MTQHQLERILATPPALWPTFDEIEEAAETYALEPLNPCHLETLEYA